MSREPDFRGAEQLPPAQADLRRQQETGRAIGRSIPEFIAGGRMVPGTLADANEGSVTHGLGRTIKGWILVSPTGDADRVSVVQTGANAQVVKLKNVGASGSLSFQLWVW